MVALMHLWSKRKEMQLEKLVKHKIEPSRKNHIPLHLLLSQSKLSDQLNIWDWRETTILVNADLDFYIFNIFIHVCWLTGHITNNFPHNIILHLKCLLVKVVADTIPSDYVTMISTTLLVTLLVVVINDA